MDLNLLTIARRAKLADNIHRAFSNTEDRIEQIRVLSGKITNSEEFSTLEKVQNLEFSVIGIVSITEQFLNEIMYQILISFPSKFGTKKFEVDELMEEGSILELFHKKANQKLLDLAYGKFERFIANFSETLELTGKLSVDLVDVINEIKCTRDCLLHSQGKATDLYIAKSGSKSRVRMTNDTLKVDEKYFEDSLNNIVTFISEIKQLMPTKFTASNRSYVFKQMWDATCLARRVEFERAWEIESASMIRPIDLERTFGFSTSEMEVYNLFRHIYNNRYKINLVLFFNRWKPQSNENQIATSWLENQFYF